MHVRDDLQAASPRDEPARRGVVPDVRARSVPQVRVSRAERDQLPIPRQHRGVGFGTSLRPIESRALEGLGGLWIRNPGSLLQEGRELAPPAVTDGCPQCLVLMVGEVLEWRGRCPLLAGEQQWNEWSEQHQRGTDLRGVDGHQVPDPLAGGAVAHLVVVLEEPDEPDGLKVADRSPVGPATEWRVAPVEHEHPTQGCRNILDARVLGVVGVGLPGQRDVDRVPIVVIPLGVEAVAAEIDVPYEARIIQVALRRRNQVAAEPLPERMDR